MRIKRIYIQLFVSILVLSCGQRQEAVTTPWGERLDTIVVEKQFDLDQIQAAGELIVLTISGPETYYDYHGQQLGTQYLLCQRYAQQIGVSLRIEVCRDTIEAMRRLDQGEGDLSIWGNNGIKGWHVSKEKSDLKQSIEQWYQPEFLARVQREEAFALSHRSVQRRVFAPMLNRSGGVISRYDHYFMTYSQPIHWDWRLMAAQCYQESTFDPQAHSWAGACGLMQIMPATAEHLGLSMSQIYVPEHNIAAAARYIKELDGLFADVRERNERTKFVLASYNGGHYHIRDAMALTRKYGGNPLRWNDVSKYVLLLSQPAYYTDPVVRNGYMRGSETVDYVSRIMQRWAQYRGVKVSHAGQMMGTPQPARHPKKKYKI